MHFFFPHEASGHRRKRDLQLDPPKSAHQLFCEVSLITLSQLLCRSTFPRDLLAHAAMAFFPKRKTFQLHESPRHEDRLTTHSS